jgi:hypothetical protein
MWGDDLICPLSKLTQHNIKVINKLKNSFKWGITFVLYQNLPKQSGFFFFVGNFCHNLVIFFLKNNNIPLIKRSRKLPCFYTLFKASS